MLLAVKTLFIPNLQMNVLVQQEDKLMMLILFIISGVVVLWKTEHKCHLVNGKRPIANLQ